VTPDEFREAGHALVEWIAAYRERLATGEYPVQATVQPGEILSRLPSAAPERGESFGNVLRDFDSALLPGITHWQHPSFFGYFPSGGSLSSVLADMMSTGLGVIGLSWQASPALTELEQRMTDWLRDLLGLPARFSGVLQDTASSATLVSLICARERASQYGAARAGLQDRTQAPLIVYTSSQSHSSVEKAALLAGFGRENVRAIETDKDFRMMPSKLEEAILRDRAARLQPCAIVATSGTTATTAFDPIPAIAPIAQRERVWLHVDGAMGGSAMILPEYRHYWEGIEAADSIVVNPHKWLSTAFDCSLYLVRDPEHLVRVMSTNPSYLQSAVDAKVRNYRDWGIPLGRRFRALKLWMALRTDGAEALRRRLRTDIDNARWLASEIERTAPWKCVAPVTLQTVCVRHEPSGLTGDALDEHTRHWTSRINDSGKAYLTPAVVGGRWMTRISIGSEYVSRQSVADLWRLMRETATASAAARIQG
jgi:aromatic-L-amino-acid/L-tryptophan decarboxylase